MKKIIIVFILMFCLLTSANAFYVDSDLIKVWNKRIDLQKAFPDKNSTELVEWAKKYGWEEDDSLIKYSPTYNAINSLSDEKSKLQSAKIETQNEMIANLTKRIDFLEKNIFPSGVPLIQKVDNTEWIKCCNGKCGRRKENYNCDKEGIGSYVYYINVKDYVTFSEKYDLPEFNYGR